MSSYVVLGASGHTGRMVAESLLRAGRKVRVVGRDRAKLAGLRGAEIAGASLEDFSATAEALRGATAAYVLVPPNHALRSGGLRAYQNRVVNCVIEGLRRAGTSHVVTLSSVGAHLPTGVGLVGGLYDMEKAFAMYLPKANVLHLRSAFFMENNLGNIGAIKQTGVMSGPTAADVRMPIIATRDIGAVASERLLALDFTGQGALELLGPRDVTMSEVAAVLGAAIGKPELGYVALPYADAVKGMVRAGLPEELAGMYAELSRAFNEGMKPTQPRSPATTTPTSIEEFARTIFAPAFAAC